MQDQFFKCSHSFINWKGLDSHISLKSFLWNDGEEVIINDKIVDYFKSLIENKYIHLFTECGELYPLSFR